MSFSLITDFLELEDGIKTVYFSLTEHEFFAGILCFRFVGKDNGKEKFDSPWKHFENFFYDLCRLKGPFPLSSLSQLKKYLSHPSEESLPPSPQNNYIEKNLTSILFLIDFLRYESCRMSLISSCNRNKWVTSLQGRDYSFKLFIQKAMTQLIAIWESGGRYWRRPSLSCPRCEMAGCELTDSTILKCIFQKQDRLHIIIKTIPGSANWWFFPTKFSENAFFVLIFPIPVNCISLWT